MPSISWAKGWLREQGRGRLASRLSRLSRARNPAAHLDVRLLADMQRVAVDTSCSSEDRSELDGARQELVQHKGDRSELDV